MMTRDWRATLGACVVLGAVACASTDDPNAVVRPPTNFGTGSAGGDVGGSAGTGGASPGVGSTTAVGGTGFGGASGSGGSGLAPSGGGTSGGSGGASGSGGGTSGLGGASGSGGTSGSGGSAGTGGGSGSGGASGSGGTSGSGGSAGTGGGGPAPMCDVGDFVVCDDFESGSDGWTPTGGTWSVGTDGSGVYIGGIGNHRSTVGTSYGDQTVEARMKVLQFGGSGSSYRAGIVARDAGGSNFYVFGIDAAGTLRLLRGTSSPSGGTGTCNDQPSGITPVLNTWVTLRMQVSGPQGNVRNVTWLNDTQVHDCTSTGSTVGMGRPGVLSYGSNTRAAFDDFRVTTP